MNKRLTTLLAAAALSLPIVATAQNAPQAEVIATRGQGEASVTEAIQLQGKVKSIDKQARSVVVIGAQGAEVVFTLPPEARNFDQIRVGDLVTLTYVQAVALELRRVQTNGIRERIESTDAVQSKPGAKPAAGIERTVTVIADVVAVNPKAQTVTLRGPQRTVELTVKDPAVLKAVKVGNQVEAIFTEAIGLEVTKAPAK